MMYFGESWGAPICNEIEQTPTPVGVCCGWCEESFIEGDRGFAIPGVEGTEPPYKAIQTYFHYECHLRQVIGSLGHQTGHCSCYGGEQEDPPHMTKREAAKAACDFFEFRQKFGISLK